MRGKAQVIAMRIAVSEAKTAALGEIRIAPDRGRLCLSGDMGFAGERGSTGTAESVERMSIGLDASMHRMDRD